MALAREQDLGQVQVKVTTVSIIYLSKYKTNKNICINNQTFILYHWNIWFYKLYVVYCVYYPLDIYLIQNVYITIFRVAMIM